MSLSDDAKRAYVERTKAANYQASLRLEGFAERKIPKSNTLEESKVLEDSGTRLS
jgi:hypothetical protein